MEELKEEDVVPGSVTWAGLGRAKQCGIQSQRDLRCEARILLGCPTLHTTYQKHCDLRLHPSLLSLPIFMPRLHSKISQCPVQNLIPRK